jgi:glutathione-regulated potassium-efflux system protein KefB
MPREEQSMEGVEAANGLGGSVLVIGFGRFGQVVSQSLLARGFDIAIIDTDTEMIRSAADFGFKIYYGDGTRLDVLKASGAERARLIAVCVDNREAADRIVALARSEFPHAKLLVRAFDRAHSLKLVGAGVDYQVRETFQSAMAFGEAALLQLGVPEAEAAQVAEEVRRRDNERFEAEIAGGLAAGAALIRGNLPKPTPFTTPRQAPQPLSAETAAVAASQGASTAS